DPGDEVLGAHPEWLVAAGHPSDLPDPRKTAQPGQSHQLDFGAPGTAAQIEAWWANRLVQLASSGVAGFCLRLDGLATAAFFSSVMTHVRVVAPDCRFLAWTPGLAAERVVSLGDAGFDAAFSSGAWWDFRSTWLMDEALRLAPYRSVIGLACVPGNRAEFHGRAEAERELRRRSRSLWLAAMTADGLLVRDAYLADLALLQAEASEAPLPPPTQTLQRALSLCAVRQSMPGARPWELLSPPSAPAALLRAGSFSGEADEELVMVANACERPVKVDVAGAVARFDGLALVGSWWPAGDAPESGEAAELLPAEARIYTARRTRAAGTPPKEPKRAAEAASKAPRIVIEGLSPCVDNGRFIAKRQVGDTLVVEADIFGEGHDRIAAVVRWRAADETEWQETPLLPLVNDRWRAELLLPRLGRYHYQVEAWIDVFGAYRDEIDKKTAAGQHVTLELQEGRLLLLAAAGRAEKEDRKQLGLGLRRALKTLDEEPTESAKVAHLLSSGVHQLMSQADERAFKVPGVPVMQVDAERRAAGFSSWDELFPRSMGPDATTHGTFADVVARLPAIREMGFDTLYFPPIHPIGRKHRKGPNNSLEAGPGDPGSPYAIGSAEGGHDAIHPQLGSLDDFRALRVAAEAEGLELALDFAIQCSPDHPWLQQHPDWFSWRPDGSIRYAENPPKKYQDIVNVDFYAKGAIPGLWVALRDVVLFWVREGIKVFRVDNPHTKPMPFWEWLIADVRGRYPEVIFLAEAFTRPKPMYRLAKLGFSQSYTYFTWRHTKQEFIDYLTELTEEPPRDFFRPHFFVNTPDINPYFLQRSGRAGFVIRAALAATLSGLWGMYSGFELCEAAPVPGKEEYLDSE
ncbi:MAG: glgE, partial [Polaromonas sp.]|nr:glgE [Polaromonas sp.]